MNPKIFRVRKDLTWSSVVSKALVARTRHLSMIKANLIPFFNAIIFPGENIWKEPGMACADPAVRRRFFEEFARDSGFDPKVAEK